MDPHTVDMLNRLAIVGETGMGALTYRPVHQLQSEQVQYDYDRISEECRKILESEYSEDLDMLFTLGGSSGGARPKILVKIDGEDWIVKFPASVDRKKYRRNRVSVFSLREKVWHYYAGNETVSL